MKRKKVEPPTTEGAVAIVERLAVAQAWILDAMIEWTGRADYPSQSANLFRSLVSAQVKTWGAIREFAMAYGVDEDTANISLIEGAANAHLATLRDTYEGVDAILARMDQAELEKEERENNHG